MARYFDVYEEGEELSPTAFADLLRRNFTHSIVTLGHLVLRENALLRGPMIGVYAGLVNVTEGAGITTSGRGCPSGQGPGAGSGATDDCAGGGAAHAGNGGFGLNKTAYADGKAVPCRSDNAMSYGGNDAETVSLGSGGGSTGVQNAGGAGGGLIYLTSNQLIIDGDLSSSGANPGQGVNDAGGGAGGTVQLETYYFKGNGTIEAAGGLAAPQQALGGAGSGGRIRIRRIEWTNETYLNEWSDNQEIFNLNVSGG